MYASKKAERGEQEISDTKARITYIPLAISDGELGPDFFIVKHSVSSTTRADQTGMRVISNLHKVVGFRREDGWELKTWERTMTIKNRKDEDVTATHKVKYIIHTSGSVVTSQHKAWNDTVRMAMYIDLILKPFVADKCGGKFFLWMDNVGSHKTDALHEIFREACVEVGYLPPNMTQFLQVLDLVVNGPLKAHIRRLRAENLMKYFRQYKCLYNDERQKPQEQRVIPKWNPPKPSMEECILAVMELMTTGDLTTTKAKASIAATFEKTGNVAQSNGEFVKFTYSASGGTIEISPTDTVEKYSISQNELDQPQHDEPYSFAMDIIMIEDDCDLEFDSNPFDNEDFD